MAAAHHFDCVVLGGGSGGIAFARRAATYGAKVALVERSRMGGTCVNVGCVPKKIMWCAANAFESLQGMKHLGVEFSDPPRLNWQRLVQNRENYIKRLNRIYEDNLDKSQVHRYYGFATLKPKDEANGQHVVVVNSSKEEAAKGAEPLQRLTAKHVLIATGGRPSPLRVPGGELCIDSAGFFALQQQPRKVGVVGGGYIAVELAAVLQSLGSETHFFCRQHAPLRKFDSMIQQQNLDNMRKLGIQVFPHSVPAAVKGSSGALLLQLENGQQHGPFECIINATGRTPETEDLNLQTLNVEMINQKYIKTDSFQNTNVPGIFALGDCCGKVELTPMAIAAGRRLADRVYGHLAHAKADYDFVPSVIFSHPPIGSVGFSEEEAAKQFGKEDLKVYNGSCVNLLYGAYQIPPEEKPKTFIKLICLKSQKEKIVGLHLVGLSADEILQGFAVAIKMGATKADLDRCVAIHPTAAEEIVTLAPWGLSEEPNPKP